MTNPDFRTAIRNQSIAVKGEILAGHIRKESAAALRKELAEMSGSGNVRKTAGYVAHGPGLEPPKPFERQQQRPENMGPEALVEEFSQACEAAVDAVYRGVRDWAPLTILNGVISQGPMVLCGPGSIKPDRCPMMFAHLNASLPGNMPDWARKFARGMVNGVDDAINLWVTSINLAGIPLFPAMAPGPNIPWPMTSVPQAENAISASMIDTLMMSAGARVHSLPNSESPGSRNYQLDASARKYTAKVVSGMLTFSLLGASIRNLTRVSGAPNSPMAPVVSSPGLLADLASTLPEPSKWSVNGFPQAGLDTAIREDLVKVAYGAVGVPVPPEQPPGTT